MDTLELPKNTRHFEWRCCNADCAALMRAERGEAFARYHAKDTEMLEFRCPYCQWHTTVKVPT